MFRIFRKVFVFALGASATALPNLGRADTTITITATTADAFLASGSPGNPVGTDLSALNFGAAGTLAIAPASSVKGEFDSVIKFNLVAATSQFNTTYGVGNWAINGLLLKLASSFGTQGAVPSSGLFNTISGGNFNIKWLSNDSWVEGAGGGTGGTGYPNSTSVSFQSIPTLLSGPHDVLGTFSYVPPGNNVYASYTLPLNADLVTDAAAGGDVSLYFSAADNQVSYLFNAKSFSSNFPEFVVTATPAPEPGTVALMAVSAGCLVVMRRKKCER